MTVMGDALVDGLSDAGSTPARSIGKSIRYWFIINSGWIFYFQDSCSCFFCFAQSERYRLISVWYGIPESSLCALKKLIVSQSMLIETCFDTIADKVNRCLRCSTSDAESPLLKIKNDALHHNNQLI